MEIPIVGFRMRTKLDAKNIDISPAHKIRIRRFCPNAH